MEIFNAVAAIMKLGLTPQEIVEFLPMLLNITQVVLAKGEKHLSDTSIIYLQTEIEKLRKKL